MNIEPDEFARRHPSLDRALREQIRAPVLDAAFRRQVMARVAAQRSALAQMAERPGVVRSRLRLQLLLKVLNAGAVALVAVLVFGVLAPQLESLRGLFAMPASWMQQAGIAGSLVVSAAALFYGLQRARLLERLRGFDFL